MVAGATYVLHVEDDPNDVLLFEQACRKAGAHFVLKNVCDGDQAIAYLSGKDAFSNRQDNPLPQLVLLDLKMPRISGFEVLSWLRGKEIFQRTPVIMLTSSNQEADVRRAYDLGANSYLVKPVSFEALVEMVKGIQGYWLNWNQGSRVNRP